MKRVGTVLNWTRVNLFQSVIGCLPDSSEKIDKNENRKGNTEEPEERQGDPAKEAFAIFSISGR
jgi:hypothetical protein